MRAPRDKDLAARSGFWVAMFFFSLGSTIYCYLLLKSRYVPRLLALSGVAASALFVVGILTRGVHIWSVP